MRNHTFFTSLFLFLMVLIACAPVGMTQDQVTQTTVIIPKKALVEQNMQIAENQAAEFWKIYGEYEIALDQIHQKIEELIRGYAKNQRTLTDEDAQAMVDKYFQIERDKISLRESYIPKFKTILSGRQVARLYQIENKIEAVVKFGMVDAIPLVDSAAPAQEAPHEQ